MKRSKMKHLIGAIYVALTLFLLFTLGMAVVYRDMSMLQEYAFNAVFIPWLLLLVVRLKMRRMQGRTRRCEYEGRLRSRMAALRKCG